MAKRTAEDAELPPAAQQQLTPEQRALGMGDPWFVHSIDEIKPALKKHGFAVIQVLDDAECAAAFNGMWDALEHLSSGWDTPIDRNNPATYKGLHNAMLLHGMMMQHYGIGHAQFVWELRQNPKIAAIFAAIWGCTIEELLVSYDGIAAGMPPEITGKGWYEGKDWLHTDQSYQNSDLQCIQGWVSARPVRDKDATLVVLEGSHNHHAAFAKKFADPNKKWTAADWYLVRGEQLDWYEKEMHCTRRAIRCPAGSLVVWDSRTIHMGQEPIFGREVPEFRCVSYLCYTPRSFATKEQLEKKRKRFNERRMTTHWPHKARVFPPTPHTWGKALPPMTPFPEPVLNELGKKLAGF